MPLPWCCSQIFLLKADGTRRSTDRCLQKAKTHVCALASQTQVLTGAMSQLYPPLKGLLGQEVESVEGIQRKKGLSVRIDDKYSGGDLGGFPMRERDNSIHEAGEVEQLYGKM